MFAVAPAPLLRRLPVALLATASVLLAPALLVRLILRPGGLLSVLGGALLAAGLSIAIARIEASFWQRRRRASDIVYAELMLWGLARRWWVERHLLRMCAAYQRAAAEEEGRVELLEGLSRLLESRNAYTYRHCRRVARHAEQIARAMHLSAGDVSRIRSAALVHDVGKIYTPLAILHKPAPLDDEEYAVVKRHAADGADMLGPVRDRELARIVRHHHERIDGSGYPDGLAGEQIPIGARIVAVADTFDAITSMRPYRRARSHREAIAVLQSEAGRQLDSRAVEVFVSGYSARRSVASVAVVAAMLDRIGGALLPAGFGLGGSAGQLLPVLGAAGMLAVTPGARYERPVQHDQSVLSGALASPLGAALGGAAASTLGAGAPASRAAPPLSGSRAPRAGLHTPRGGSRRGTRHTGTPGEQNAGAGGSTAPVGSAGEVHELPGSGGKVKVKVPGLPGTPSSGSETPVGETPPVTTPPVTTPPVSTPPVSVPPVQVGPVTTPTVELPAVHVPSVEVPPVKLPGVKLP